VEKSSDTSELEGDDEMMLFFVKVLTEQRVRVACRTARRAMATDGVWSPRDRRGWLSGVGN
jgi:hypothetical protein